jgi:hypothetical protein
MINQLQSFAPIQAPSSFPSFPAVAMFAQPASMTSLETLMGRFDPISLKEMDDVALLDRTDTKYVLQTGQLQQALAQLTDRYRVLTIKGNRLNHYQTVYFDTPDFDLYNRHHDGSHSRYKVRAREYVDSHLAFLEVKFKTNKNRTIKNRMQTPDVVTAFDQGTANFVHDHYPDDPAMLEPKLWNQFVRITLVSKSNLERLTLDVNLEFQRDQGQVGLPGIAIAEVKQDGFNMQSDFIRQMRGMGVRPSGFSKYCMGVASLYDEVKKNNFKPRMLQVGKLMNGEVM